MTSMTQMPSGIMKSIVSEVHWLGIGSVWLVIADLIRGRYDNVVLV